MSKGIASCPNIDPRWVHYILPWLKGTEETVAEWCRRALYREPLFVARAYQNHVHCKLWHDLIFWFTRKYFYRLNSIKSIVRIWWKWCLSGFSLWFSFSIVRNLPSVQVPVTVWLPDWGFESSWIIVACLRHASSEKWLPHANLGWIKDAQHIFWHVTEVQSVCTNLRKTLWSTTLALNRKKTLPHLKFETLTAQN